MSVFPDWQKYVVVQKRAASGCIPTGYEMLLRVAGVEGINYDTFQDEFDLDKDGPRDGVYRNNFDSVAEVIHSKYPYIRFSRTVFDKGKGVDKVHFIEDSIRNKRLVLISVYMHPITEQYGYHIMPVVDIDEDTMIMIYGTTEKGEIYQLRLKKSRIAFIHDSFDGGNDVAYLEND